MIEEIRATDLDAFEETVRIGLLHSINGTMAVSEKHLLDVEMLAIEELNEAGGVLGKQIEPIPVDGASEPAAFARHAGGLLDSGIDTLFGCWTSSSRKAVKPLVEAANGLLWYPVQYEGLEASRHIVYTGSSLNQQISPALEWAMQALGLGVFLLGSDFVFPRTANLLARALVERKRAGGEIVGEVYVPLGDHDLEAAVGAIARSKPSFVLNTLNGDSNHALFRELRAAKVSAEEIPVLSMSLAEEGVAEVADLAAGHYACWNYFQSLDTPANKDFLKRFHARFGDDRVCSAPMALSWYQIHLWKQAVEAAGSFEADALREHLVGQSFDGPGGPITIRPNHHVTLPAHVGRCGANGQFEVVWSSPEPIEPLPWLGVEEMDFPERRAVLRALEAYPEAIHQSAQLAVEVRERSRAEDELLRAHEELELRVRARTAELEDTNATLKTVLEERQQVEEILTRQARELLEVGTPVLPLARGLVLAPLIGALDGDRAQQLTERLLERIEELSAEVAIIDITGVPEIDTFTAQSLIETFTAVGLLGCRVVMTGVRPSIAQTLVHLSVDLSRFETCSSLSAGLELGMALVEDAI
jgi:urea ABC transporter urea binding protein